MNYAFSISDSHNHWKTRWNKYNLHHKDEETEAWTGQGSCRWYCVVGSGPVLGAWIPDSCLLSFPGLLLRLFIGLNQSSPAATSPHHLPSLHPRCSLLCCHHTRLYFCEQVFGSAWQARLWHWRRSSLVTWDRLRKNRRPCAQQGSSQHDSIFWSSDCGLYFFICLFIFLFVCFM